MVLDGVHVTPLVGGSVEINFVGNTRDGRTQALQTALERVLVRNPASTSHIKGRVTVAAVTPGVGRGDGTMAWRLQGSDATHSFGEWGA